MSKKIEEELAEMNRLKRLELEFLFFRAGMDNSLLEKYREALINKNSTVEQLILNSNTLKCKQNPDVYELSQKI